MSFTTEITLWCDYPDCAEWVQFNYNEAQGHPRPARKLAKRLGWSWSPDKGDRCREHADA